MQVADTGVVLGKVACRSGPVTLDDLEESCAAIIAQKRQLVIGRLLLETVLRLGDQGRCLLGTRSDDKRPVTEDQRRHDEQRENQIRHRPAVLLEEELGPVHCFAERFLPGSLLICHNVCYC